MDNEDVVAPDTDESRPPTLNDLRQICESLNAAKAMYMLIGGLAVNYYGYPRSTHDIDFLVDGSEANVEKIRTALAILPDKASLLVERDDVKNYNVVRIADEIVIDIIGAVGDVKYTSEDVEKFDMDGTIIPVATLDKLIKTKQGLREKDKEDLRFLLSLKGDQDKDNGLFDRQGL